MKVETYEIEGCTEVNLEEEAKILIEELALEGQKSLITDQGDRIPYNEMTVEQKVVFSTLLTQHTPMEKYSAGPIPLRVLQVAAHAKKLFTTVEVWHEPTEIDPLLVGKIGDKQLYLLARWGEVFEEWKILVDRAKEKFKNLVIAQAQKSIKSSQVDIANADSIVNDKFMGKWVSYY